MKTFYVYLRANCDLFKEGIPIADFVQLFDEFADVKLIGFNFAGDLLQLEFSSTSEKLTGLKYFQIIRETKFKLVSGRTKASPNL